MTRLNRSFLSHHVIKENGESDEQAGNAYANLLLSDQGQQLLFEAGFIPIRSR
ncbi:hypothetical protein [Gloeocapsa sp. PCC 73106]|uniref:hypothetical protein n=1 Tax=Gloeocapsa sp. PCC 73106 TaxID=102232 RepID=UPI0002AC320D|nr:hypothetical protein [Gloeocapsa sp. PCC 73106]ELR98693.1 hypothetical protein GLO73106DRAFT_00025310 [Gloeocapsa sp. PCC 73106]